VDDHGHPINDPIPDTLVRRLRSRTSTTPSACGSSRNPTETSVTVPMRGGDLDGTLCSSTAQLIWIGDRDWRWQRRRFHLRP